MHLPRIRQRSMVVTVIVLLAALSVVGSGLAAGVGRVAITLVDTATFPTVTVYLAVTDVDRQPLTDLQPEEITLYENDVQKDVTLEAVAHPMLIGVVVDSSGSFATSEGGAPRVDHAREAARQLVSPDYGRLAEDDEVAVFAFANGQPIRLVDFTYDHNLAINEGLNKVSTEGNEYTALFDLLRQAIEDAIGRQGVRRRALLVFSDGTDVTSGIEVDRVIQQAVEAHLLIHTVGLGPNLAPDQPNSAFMRRLADETGGRYLWYQPGRPGADRSLATLLDGLVAQRQGYAVSYQTQLYEGTPEVKVVVNKEGRVAEDTATYKVPPLSPQVAVENIQSGQVLVGTVTVRPAITRDQRPIDRVEYRVDGELVYTALTAPWTFEWDTRPHATSPTEAERRQLTVIAYDIGGYSGEANLTVGVRLPPPPTPTPTPHPTPTPGPTPTPPPPPKGPYVVAGIALAVAIASLILLLIVIRQGGVVTVGRQVAREVRKRTRVWRKRTDIFGGAARARSPTLVVASDTYKGKEFEIDESVVYLGREEERADLVFFWDEYISRRHAKIGREGEQFYLWDLNSANGTWVNGRRVPNSLSEGIELSEAVLLDDGATIRLGPDLRLTFHLGGPPLPAAVPPQPGLDREAAQAVTEVVSGTGAPSPPPTAQYPISQSDIDTLTTYRRPAEET